MSEFTAAEVAEHCTPGNIWVIFQDEVYDVSEFKHPGGAAKLLAHAGADVTVEAWTTQAHTTHNAAFNDALRTYKIGKLKHV